MPVCRLPLAADSVIPSVTMPVPLVVMPPAEIRLTTPRLPPEAESWPTLMLPLPLVLTSIEPPLMLLRPAVLMLPLLTDSEMSPLRAPLAALPPVLMPPVLMLPLPL